MRKDLFYQLVIAALFLLNAGTLAYLVSERRPHHPPHPNEIVVERLHLDSKQEDQFDDLRHDHHSHMVEINERLNDQREDLFLLLQKDPVDSTTAGQIIAEITRGQQEKELVTFHHFRQLRGILREEQKPLFDDLVNELSRRIMQGPPPRGREGGRPPGPPPPQ
jgi:periplasmic protein CpxP/Spy